MIHARLAAGSASAVALATVIAAAPAGAQDGCAALAAPEMFAHTTVTSAASVPADAETGAPAHCAVEATLSPVEGSRIGVVYRLPPREDWNGKLLGLGGGGWAGNVRLTTAVEGLSRGYATLQTDGGHAAGSPLATDWAADAEGRANMVAIEDFGHRAVHEMTARGKEIAAAYYGRAQDLAYWQGCSTGGRQGLMEVQRYPDDYDGVIAGAPVYDFMTQVNGWVRARNFSAPERMLAPSHPALIAAAVRAACDAADGAEDGIVQDPRACDWDPAALACAPDAADDSACLTPDQVDAVRTVYAGQRISTGEMAAHPAAHGAEEGWGGFARRDETEEPDERARFRAGDFMDGLKDALFGDPNFDLDAFDPETDMARLRANALSPLYEANDADIAGFTARGGKLLMWHGLYDPGPSPFATVDYYERVLADTADAAASVRLFLAPGMGHCRGGPGANVFDTLAALEAWVEDGVAPDTIPARNEETGLAWPLCPYPALPHGRTDADGATTYVCAP